MKHGTIYVAAALAGALAIGAMAGCSGQPASSASASASGASSASSASASASASSEAAAQPQDELIAELKTAIAGAPAFKSVTVTDDTESVIPVANPYSSASASASAASAEAADSNTSAASSEASETITSTSVYKFDASGDKLKTSLDTAIDDVKLQYITDGDDAVYVTDGPIYSGTTKQFGMSHTDGFEAWLKGTIGDLNTLADCAATTEKTESDGVTVYMLTLDPEKYIASDEILGLMAKEGDPVTQALLSIGFNQNGSIASIDLGVSYEKKHMMTHHLVLSDYDSTVIDPMPAADKTYEDMEADIQQKLDEFEKQAASNSAE